VFCARWQHISAYVRTQVPFALLATAYRRKRIMEGLISGDKEMTAQVTRVPGVMMHVLHTHHVMVLPICMRWRAGCCGQ
jgi:hypothetical protein